MTVDFIANVDIGFPRLTAASSKKGSLGSEVLIFILSTYHGFYSAGEN